MTTGTWKTTIFMSTWWWTGREKKGPRVWRGVEATLQAEAPVASASQASPAKFEMRKNKGFIYPLISSVKKVKFEEPRKPRLMWKFILVFSQEGSNFQIWISHKWFEMSMIFFHIIKNWYSELYMALVSCLYPKLSKNGVRLKKKFQKNLPLWKTGQFSAFLAVWKKKLDFERL